MIYVTGDTHGGFKRIDEFCNSNKTTIDDILIILGDVGINYLNDERDVFFKRKIALLPITLFCIHGNHEMRPESTGCTYRQKEFCSGFVLVEDEFPNINFAIDGELYLFNNKKTMVIGGAYSVDKFYRLENGKRWFDDEQPSEGIKERCAFKLLSLYGNVDIMLTHTCPIKYEPIEAYLAFIEQSTVDKSTEEWLGELEPYISYEKWYCGHYHINKSIDKMQFLFDDIREFGK